MLIVYMNGGSALTEAYEVIGGANRGIATTEEAIQAVVTHYETVVKPRLRQEEAAEGHVIDSTLYLAYSDKTPIHAGMIATVHGGEFGDYFLVNDPQIYTVDLEEAKNESGEGSSTEEI